MNSPVEHEHGSRSHDTNPPGTPRSGDRDTNAPSTLRTDPADMLPPSTLRPAQGDTHADSTLRIVAIWKGGHTSCQVPLEGRLVIGRAPSVDLRIPSSSVSREHAVIIAGNPPVIQDLWSTNGTRVDDRLLEPAESAALLPGRVVEIGSVLLILQDESAPTEAPKFSDRPTVAPTEAKMDRLHRLIALAATVSLNVILQGEASVGKEMIARRIHQCSNRSRRPFLKINCARLGDSEVGRELLARSGPAPVRARLFELASGGTVFLEEVGLLPLPIQAELLRALGDAEVLSASSTLPLDVRFISSTSNDFGGLVGGSAFRSDLHYWLGGIHLYVPPLRERADEILRLARQFLDQASMRLALPTLLLSEAAEAWLKGYPWPSNIRELREVVVEAGTAAAPDTIEVTHLEMGLEIVHALGIDLEPGGALASAERGTIPDSDASDDSPITGRDLLF